MRYNEIEELTIIIQLDNRKEKYARVNFWIFNRRMHYQFHMGNSPLFQKP